MPAVIDEHTQYTDVGGKPIVNGKVYFGVATQFPKENPIPVFSDRGLTVSAPNPQTLDSSGRTGDKIYIDGRYSFKLENSSGSQLLQDLDRGESVTATIISLFNVQGVNNLTANATQAITAYIDKQQYTFTTINENTGPVTLGIDEVDAVPIKNKGVDIQPSEFLANQIIVVAYNSISNTFDLIGSGGFGLSGIVILWFGSIASIPAGYVLCDGNNGTPDLRGKFPIGAGGTYDVDETGGSVDTGEHALDISEIPPLNFNYDFSNASKGTGDDNGPAAMLDTTSPRLTNTIGGGLVHKHLDSLPPFHALAWIMKL